MPKGDQKKSAAKGGTSGRQVNFRAPPDLAERLEATAPVLGLDVSSLVRMVLYEHLAEYEARAEQVKGKRA